MGKPFQFQPGDVHETPPGAGSTDPPPSNPWLVRGIEDVYYQREVQVTWWTVLGAIAVGALVTQLSAVLAQARAGRWSLVLYFLATALIIANSWLQTAWAPLVVRQPLSVPWALLGFLSDFVLCITSLQVTNPPGWILAVSLLVAEAVPMQLYLAKSGAWAGFTPTHTAKLRGVIRIYAGFAGVTLIGGLLLVRYPGLLHETVWGVVALLGAVAALWLQDQGMKTERAALGIP